MHERACGGSFLKIKEPEPKPKDGKKVAPGTNAAPASQTIASAFAQVKAASQDLKLKPGMNEGTWQSLLRRAQCLSVPSLVQTQPAV